MLRRKLGSAAKPAVVEWSVIIKVRERIDIG
jgi:hypothetical protein